MQEGENEETIAMINSTQPDIVWVGLGAPKQERWMMRHAGKINASAMVGVGAAFDFHSGNKPWCPPVLRRAGLEWAYRLACEPKRLWSRNIDSLRFLSMVSWQAAGSILKS
jgi:N-acetylglucosaminyldiphosphoundecaprenol N-acetyl-beta-D-mannosaminyltransferase